MELSINTPALLFPAITLLMLAYTNRFLALASLVRSLHDEYNQAPLRVRFSMSTRAIDIELSDMELKKQSLIRTMLDTEEKKS